MIGFFVSPSASRISLMHWATELTRVSFRFSASQQFSISSLLPTAWPGRSAR